MIKSLRLLQTALQRLRSFAPRFPSVFLAGHVDAGNKCGSRGHNGRSGGAPFRTEQQHQRRKHENRIDRHTPTEQPEGEVETNRSNKAELGPPSATEDQHSDNRFECDEQTDKQIVIRCNDRTPSRVTQPKCAWSGKPA
jgi:hypothetical protein